MTEIKIDPNTGLPGLPEGFFFRVTKNDVRVVENLPDTKWNPGEDYGYLATGWGDTYTYEVERDNRYRVTEEEVRNRWGRKILRPKTVQETWTRRVNRQKVRGFVSPEPGEVVTPENLLSLAKQASEKLSDALANEAIRGDYPPKKFEAV